MRRRMSWSPPAAALATLLTLAAAGCQESPAGPPAADEFELTPGSYALAEAGSGAALRAEAEAFVSGGGVRLVLENGSGEPLGYNLCVHALEGRVGSGWSPLPDTRICTMELRLLQAGGSASFDAILPGDLSAGEYRFRVAVHFMETGRMRDLASAPFTVE
jgi:hypothetical protein